MSNTNRKTSFSKKARVAFPLFSQWDKKFVWHPFTQMSEWAQDDILVIESADGCYLKDVHGKRYIDGVSSLWCNVHGHRVRELDEAVRKQLGRVAHSTFLGLSNVPAIQLAKKLIEIAPRGLSRVFYSDSGSEAVEIALKIAFQYWQHRGQKDRKKFVRFTNAYHGDTIGAVSVGGIELFHSLYGPLLFKTLEAPAPYRYRDGGPADDESYTQLCAKRVESIVSEHSKEIAAIILEPLIQGAAGMITQPRGFISRVRSLANRYNILLILDEVATGFGRTGRMFACEHEAVTPDILCVAKGLSGGYLPLAATLTTETVYEAFLGRYEEFKTFFHGHTYTANPLACAVSLANLGLFEKKKVLEKLAAKINFLGQTLKRFWNLKHVGDVRQAGFMVGIELVKNRSTKEGYPLEDKVGVRVILEARRRGVMIRPLGNVIVVMPPLSIGEKVLGRLVDVVYRSIEAVTERAN